MCTIVYNISMRNKFGERLRELLEEKNLSVNKFAAKIGVSPSAVSAWTRGVKQPTADNIIACAEFFGVSSDYILGVNEYR